MAGSKLTELDEETSPAGSDLLYIVTDPDGTPTSKVVKIENLPGGGGSKIEAVDSPASASVTTTADYSQPGALAISYAGDGSAEATLAAEAWDGHADVWAGLAADGGGTTAFYFSLHEGNQRAAFFNAYPVQVPIQIDSSDTLENRVAALEAALVALGLLEDTASA